MSTSEAIQDFNSTMFAVTNIVVAQNVTADTLQSRFSVSSTADLKNPLTGYIDRVNGAVVAKLNDPNHPITIDVSEIAVVEGWVASGDYATAKSLDELYAVLSSTLVKAETVPRPDVGAYLKNPVLNMSGYRIQLGPNVLHKDLQSMELVGYMRDSGKLYRYPETLYLYGR